MEYKLPMAEEKTKKKMKGRKRVGRTEGGGGAASASLLLRPSCRSWAPPAASRQTQWSPGQSGAPGSFVLFFSFLSSSPPF